MRLAGPAALALLLAACASAGEPPPPAWSEWSEPLKGLSGRVSVPRSVLRGDRVAAVLELRVDAATVPAGKRWFDPRWIEDRVRLRLRHAGTGATVELDVHPWERVIETPELTGNGIPAERADPGWIPLAEVDGRRWWFGFPLAAAWEALEPGPWEASLVLDQEHGGGAPAAWSGTLATPPLLLGIREAPPRRLLFRPPVRLRMEVGDSPPFVEIAAAPGDSEPLDLAPRNGFFVGVRVRPSGDEWGWTESLQWGPPDEIGVDTLFPSDRGPVDRTYELEVFESPWRPDLLRDLPYNLCRGYRTLWKGTLRLTATAEELEAVRGQARGLPR